MQTIKFCASDRSMWQGTFVEMALGWVLSTTCENERLNMAPKTSAGSVDIQ